MTNPYGNEPGHHPDGLGVPGAQGPQFVPPTGPYGSPPAAPSYGPPSDPSPPAPPSGPYATAPYGGPPQPYGQNPYRQPHGQSAAQNPSGRNAYGSSPHRPPNPYQAPTGFTPPPRKSSSGPLIALGAIIAVLALGLVGWVVLRSGTDTPTAVQPTPSRPSRTAATTAATAKTSSTVRTAATTSTPSATDPVTECVAGDTITTARFGVTVPTGWFCDGGDGDISLASATYSGLLVDHETGTFGPDDCADQLYGYGTVAALPDESWGGVTAKAFRSVDGEDVYGVRCVVVAGQTWYLIYYPHDAQGETSVRADVTTILKTWVWK